jgi:hypothetical protein
MKKKPSVTLVVVTGIVWGILGGLFGSMIDALGPFLGEHASYALFAGGIIFGIAIVIWAATGTGWRQ